jgi:hypothetical protein
MTRAAHGARAGADRRHGSGARPEATAGALRDLLPRDHAVLSARAASARQAKHCRWRRVSDHGRIAAAVRWCRRRQTRGIHTSAPWTGQGRSRLRSSYPPAAVRGGGSSKDGGGSSKDGGKLHAAGGAGPGDRRLYRKAPNGIIWALAGFRRPASFSDFWTGLSGWQPDHIRRGCGGSKGGQ